MRPKIFQIWKYTGGAAQNAADKIMDNYKAKLA